MTKERLAKLYGMMSAFNEAITSVLVEHETQHNVYEEGDTVETDYYKVTFNDCEFMTFSELDEIHSLLGELLEKNGVDTSKIKMGRKASELKNADFSSMSIEHI